MVARVYADSVDIAPPAKETWRDKARCLGWEGDLWVSESRRDMEKAKVLCVTECTVRAQCLAKAMIDEEGDSRRYTVRGGYGPTEREKLQKRIDEMNGITRTYKEEEEDDESERTAGDEALLQAGAA